MIIYNIKKLKEKCTTILKNSFEKKTTLIGLSVKIQKYSDLLKK